MKKTILSILIILMMAQTVFAQSCGSQDPYTPTTASHSFTDIEFALAGNPGSVTDSSLAIGATDSLSNEALSWDGTCYNYDPALPAFNNMQYNLASFYADPDFEEYWVDSYVSQDGNSVVHLFSDGYQDYVVILTDKNGEVLASRRFTTATELIVRAVAICNDDSIMVVGDNPTTGPSRTHGYAAIFTQNGGSFNIVTSARYDPYWYTSFLDVECDNEASVFAITGNGNNVEGNVFYFLTTIDPVDGDPFDFDYITDDAGSDMGSNAKIDSYPRTADDTMIMFAGLTGPLNILQGVFIISSAGLISTSSLQLLGYSTINNYNFIKDLKVFEGDGTWYISFEAQYGANTEGGIARIASTSAVQNVVIIDEDQSGPWYEISITNGGNALAKFGLDFFGEYNAGTDTLSLWNLLPSGGDSISTGPIQYFNNGDEFIALSYSINAFPIYMAILNYDDKSVAASEKMDQSFTTDHKASRWVPGATNYLQVISNQGGGIQIYGNGPSPSGLVPEFSLTTLLLAVLLAGGLVLFIVRKRK